MLAADMSQCGPPAIKKYLAMAEVIHMLRCGSLS